LTRADEAIARMSKVARDKLFAPGIHCCSSISPPTLQYYEVVEIVFYYHYRKIMLGVNDLFIQTRSGEKLLIA
jgi:hypothetical protein